MLIDHHDRRRTGDSQHAGCEDRTREQHVATTNGETADAVPAPTLNNYAAQRAHPESRAVCFARLRQSASYVAKMADPNRQAPSCTSLNQTGAGGACRFDFAVLIIFLHGAWC